VGQDLVSLDRAREKEREREGQSPASFFIPRARRSTRARTLSMMGSKVILLGSETMSMPPERIMTVKIVSLSWQGAEWFPLITVLAAAISLSFVE